MKGVSARLDENAGVRPRKDLNPGAASSSSRTKKRTRGLSFGGTSELQAGKSSRGTPKKGRVDELPTSIRDESKGKGRATSEDESLDPEVKGRSLQAHSSLPDMHSRSDLKRSLSSKDVSFMEVDDKDDDIDAEHNSRSAVSSSSKDGDARTLSQTQMPPPPIPNDSFTNKQRQPAADPPSTLSPLVVSRHSNSVSKPQTSYPLPQQPQTNNSIKQRKPDAIPKMHPLLCHKPAVTTKVSASSKATSTRQCQLQPQPQHLSTPIPVSEGVNLKPPPSQFMPLFSSTPSSRPPPLGMRRNHTFPSRTSSTSSVRQESSLTGSRGQLPRQLPHRQKGFKPPLLSLSQPQAGTQPRTRDPPRVKANANNVIAVEPGSTIATSKKASSQNSPEAVSFNPTNTSTALQSSTSSSSDSSASFHSATSSAPSHSQFHSLDDAPDCSRLNKCNQGMAEHDVAPEPPEGDTDSSFGDMSFDMDALEETMKMYD